MLATVVVLGALAGVFGLLLRVAAARFKVEGNPIADRLDALLPQTQCGQCGYPGCRPYAEAIAAGKADIDQCPPGGEAGIRVLADLLGREPKPLNPEHGVEKPKAVAVIDERTCIGCTLCLQACPVDAILGAPKQMHTVLAGECTGCELCIAPCPVDCIAMVPVRETLNTWKWPSPDDGILAAGAGELAPPQPAMPCIRCGACAEVCPASLLPQQLYWHTRARQWNQVQDYHLFDCIECGRCAAVCPSRIPLVQYYRFAKTELRVREREQEKAALARRRYAFHQARLERAKQEKEAGLRRRREALEPPAATPGREAKKAAIQAAVARAKAKKAAARRPQEGDAGP